MQIDIIDAAHMADAVNAWRLSRDKEASYSVDEVAAVDAPVMEMPSIFLAFSGMMILEREIFCSLRNHVVWARTSRVDDPLAFTVPEAFRVPDHKHYKVQMWDEKCRGMQQDQWRLLLPLVAHTAWTQRISMRDLARLAKYFGHLADNARWHPLRVRFGQLQFELVRIISEMVGGRTAHAILDHAPLIKFLYEGIVPSPQGGFVNRVGYFKYLHVSMNIATRAQVVRHRELQFVDDLWALVNTDELPYMQLNNILHMQLSARNDVWQAVLSKRACWIAQADLWQPLINAFGMNPPLPCNDGRCPFEVDARARLTDADPGCACPRFCNLYKIHKDPYRESMMAEAKKRSPFWVMEVEA